MTYPFVQSFTDLGLRRGPALGFLVHFAEGGGTVGYLSRENPNGVSVHYVIEYSGRIVQMLLESHMHSSLRPSAIRSSDDANGFFGATAARAVLGDWANTVRSSGPNHATISLEIEGFAANGPNPAQTTALIALAADVRSRHKATIRGNLGHRDFADYKACPGALIPWSSIGGHGLYADSGGSAVSYTITSPPIPWYVRAGAKVNAYDPKRPGGAVASVTFETDQQGEGAVVFVNWAPGTDPGAPSGGPFILVAGGTFDGLLILRSAVSLEPLTATVPGTLDEAAIRRDQLARDRKTIADRLLPDS